jgi:hypothetical protein
MYYSTIFTNGSGFTNQIISFIYSIIIAINEKHRVIVVDKFLDDNIQSSCTPISHIINLKELNEYLLQKYNIIVVDKYSIVNWKILSAYYGATANFKNDITEEIKDGCLFGDRLFINKYTDFNRIKGDPSYGKEKHFYLTYEISISSSDSSTTTTHKVEEIYNEILTNHIAIDISNSEYKFNFINLFHLYGYTNYYNIFDEILSKIHYAKEFENCALATIRKLEPIFNLRNSYFVSTPLRLVNTRTPTATRPAFFAQTVNVIHLRVEKDAIKHWSAVNNMSYGEFKDAIEAKYIALIQKYMDTKDKIILLANLDECMDSSVIDFLIRNDYPVVLSEKFFAYREKNAIVDLLVSRVCNNIFIGCINKQKEGSAFSHYISKMVGAEVMKIGIDIDSIKDPEYVFY